jgi:protein O-GlcNAc transferase
MPDSAHQHFQAAIASFTAGQTEQAADHLHAAVTLDPQNAQYQTAAAEIFRRTGRLSAAIDAGRRAVSLTPDEPAAHNNLGLALQDNGSTAEAEGCFRRAIELAPDYAKAHCNLGVLLTRQLRLNEAAVSLQQALRLKPDYPQALNAWGLVFQRLHQTPRAVECFRQALQRQPRYAPAMLNLGNALSEMGRAEEGEQLIRESLNVRPNYAEAWHDLGAHLEQNQRIAEAVQAYEQAWRLQPEVTQHLAATENARRCVCDWGGWEHRIPELLQVVRDALAEGRPSPLWPFASFRMPTTNEDRLLIARRHAEHISLAHLREGEAPAKPHSGSPSGSAGASPSRRPHSEITPRHFDPESWPADERLRIGFLSHELGNNVVGHLMAGLFRRFDRGRFEVVAFDYSPPDDSPLRQRIMGDCDRSVDIGSLSPADAAKCIAQERIHVLLDINSFMHRGRPEIAAYRPAPIQVSYMYPATTGAEWIDYFLTDRIVTPPGHERFFTEKLVYLPPPYLPNDSDQPIAENAPTRSDCGLPDDAFVYCSFNKSDKIDPSIFDVWMNILHRVPQGVFWQRENNPHIQDNLRREAKARGIDPARLIFAPNVPDMEQHLARHRCADLFLDTYIHGAHGTAVDGLWAGLPLLCCAGLTFTSRVAASLLTAAELPELIAGNLQQYEDLAVHLSETPDELEELRERLRGVRQPGSAFDTTRMVRNLERAFEEMWRIFRTGQRPRAIELA